MKRLLMAVLALGCVMCGSAGPAPAPTPTIAVFVVTPDRVGGWFDPWMPKTTALPIGSAQLEVRFRDGRTASALTDARGRADVVGRAEDVTAVVAGHEGYSLEIITELSPRHANFNFSQEFFPHPVGSLVIPVVSFVSNRAEPNVRLKGTILNKPAPDDIVSITAKNSSYFEQQGTDYEIAVPPQTTIDIVGVVFRNGVTILDSHPKFWFRMQHAPVDRDSEADIDLAAVTKLPATEYATTVAFADGTPIDPSGNAFVNVESDGAHVGGTTSVTPVADGQQFELTGEYVNPEGLTPTGFSVFEESGVLRSQAWFFDAPPPELKCLLLRSPDVITSPRITSPVSLATDIPVVVPPMDSGARAAIWLKASSGSLLFLNARWDFGTWSNTVRFPQLPAWANAFVPASTWGTLIVYTTSMHDSMPYKDRLAFSREFVATK